MLAQGINRKWWKWTGAVALAGAACALTGDRVLDSGPTQGSARLISIGQMYDGESCRAGRSAWKLHRPLAPNRLIGGNNRLLATYGYSDSALYPSMNRPAVVRGPQVTAMRGQAKSEPFSVFRLHAWPVAVSRSTKIPPVAMGLPVRAVLIGYQRPLLASPRASGRSAGAGHGAASGQHTAVSVEERTFFAVVRRG